MPKYIVKGYDARGVTDAYANWTNGICLFFYVAAAMSMHIHTFIATERGDLDERYLSATPILLGAAGCFLGAGVLLHVIFWRWCPDRFQNRAFCLGLTFFAGVAAMTFGKPVLLSHTTLSPGTIEASIGAVWMTYVAGWLAFSHGRRISATNRSVCNRMVRHMLSGDFLNAAAAGQSEPEGKRDFATHYNLAIAYANLGMTDKARAYLSLVEHTSQAPVNASRAAFEQAIAELRKLVDGAMVRPESHEEGAQAWPG